MEFRFIKKKYESAKGDYVEWKEKRKKEKKEKKKKENLAEEKERKDSVVNSSTDKSIPPDHFCTQNEEQSLFEQYLEIGELSTPHKESDDL